MDTYVDQKKPTETAGDLIFLSVSPKVDNVEESLIHFDLSSIPTGSQVSEAQLCLSQQNNVTGQTIQIYQVSGAWSEATTWNTKPSHNSTPLTQFTTDGGTGCIRMVYLPTTLIEAWVNNPAGNYGISLVAIGTETELRFNSSEATTGQPLLRVNYQTPTPIPTAGLKPATGSKGAGWMPDQGSGAGGVGGLLLLAFGVCLQGVVQTAWPRRRLKRAH